MKIEYRIEVNDGNYIKGEICGTAAELHRWLLSPLQIMQEKENYVETERKIWHAKYEHQKMKDSGAKICLACDVEL